MANLFANYFYLEEKLVQKLKQIEINWALLIGNKSTMR